MRLLKALRNEFLETVPFWFMRQAGRYLPEYNRIKGKKNFLQIIQDVNLATEISIQPYKRFKTDGIILFADILTPFLAIQIPLDFDETGPKLLFNVNSFQDLKKLKEFRPKEQLEYISKIIENIKQFIDSEKSETSLIGFAGAPFTMLSYLIENGNSKKLDKTKEYLFSFEDQTLEILEILTSITIEYLKFQIQSGVEIVQIFDSWGGILSKKHYYEFSFPFIKKIVKEIQSYAPIIVFVGNGAHLLDLMIATGADCLSLDWRVDSIDLIPEKIGIQGNLDPLVLLGKTERVKKEVLEILKTFSSRKNFIFNLGHGIVPNTPLHNMEEMVETIKNFKRNID